MLYIAQTNIFMFLFLSMSVFEQGVESVNNDILHGDRGMKHMQITVLLIV